MRKTIVQVFCDKCGMEIPGNPVRITPHYIQKNSDEELEKGRNVLPAWMKRLQSMEFCTECAKGIANKAWS